VKVLLGSDEIPRRRLVVRLLWEPRDAWLGVFWNNVRAGGPDDRFLIVYLCIVPFVPIAFAWRKGTFPTGKVNNV
jgi:hypothetical protein